MNPLAAIIFCTKSQIPSQDLLFSLKNNPLIKKIILVKHTDSPDMAGRGVSSLTADFPFSGRSVAEALEKACPCSYALIISEPSGVDISTEETKRFLDIAKKVDGAFYYADYYFEIRAPSNVRPVIDYQKGSIRDDFFLARFNLSL